MRAVGIRSFGGRDRLERLDLPAPTPGPGELLVRVRAAGVNPVDWKIREGLLAKRLPHRFPLVLGWDAAGVVEETGDGVADFEPSDEVFVYARKPEVQHGTYAEFLVVPESAAAEKPRSMDFAEAAAVPLAALTAWQALTDVIGLREGESVLVQSAAGGVGHFAVQIGREVGARVVALARARHHAWLRSLGADVVLDPGGADLADRVRAEFPGGLDAVLESRGLDSMRRTAALLRDGGRLASILEDPTPLAGRIEARYLFVSPNGRQLAHLAGLADAGRLTTHLEEVFLLEDAARAHEKSESGHARGKTVLWVG